MDELSFPLLWMDIYISRADVVRRPTVIKTPTSLLVVHVCVVPTSEKKRRGETLSITTDDKQGQLETQPGKRAGSCGDRNSIIGTLLNSFYLMCVHSCVGYIVTTVIYIQRCIYTR